MLDLSMERFITLHKKDMPDEDKINIINYGDDKGDKSLSTFLKYEDVLNEYIVWLETMTLSPYEQMMCRVARNGL